MEAGKARLDLHGRHLLLRKRIVKIRRPEKKQAERTNHSMNRGKACQQSPVRASGASGVAFGAEWASTVCGPAQTAEHAAADNDRDLQKHSWRHRSDLCKLE